MSIDQAQTDHPLAYYQSRFSRTEADLQKVQRRYLLISNLRLVVFVAGAGLSYWLFTLHFWWGMLAGVSVLLAFMYLLKVHSEVAEQRDHQRRLRRILEEEIAAQNWDYSQFDDAQDLIDPQHPFSYDLDLFGPRSIFQYLNRSGTEEGRHFLAQWMQQPEQDIALIKGRQGAAQDLAQKPDWSLHYQALMRGHRAIRTEIKDLLTWLDHPPLFQGPLWKGLAFGLPMALLISLLLWIVPDFPIFQEAFGEWHLSGFVPLFFFLSQLALAGVNLKRSNYEHQQVSQKARLLSTYAQLLTQIETQTWESPRLQALQAQLTHQEFKASEAIAKLGELVYRFDQRLNMVAGVLLNGVATWDLRYILKLQAWRQEHLPVVPQWFEVIHELDALLSLGRLAFNRPDLVWADFEAGPFHYEAKDLGHVLLRPDNRVDNSVSLGKPGEFLVVTGANMAGKSTFLRSVGTSLVMAMMGAPVCASSLALAPIPLISSVRATDSLADHESYFYAELKQLKRIIDQLQAHGPAFVIVDEMLRGTNSRDKQLGSRRFIEQLIRWKGVGLVATHDLSLGTLADEYPDFVRNKRFEVDISDEQLSFDYRLRDGISQNLNATFLMQQMGIMPKEDTESLEG
ncbi:MAG: hypothetical protein AAF804_01110 [Bacteroidota bacterium]